MLLAFPYCRSNENRKYMKNGVTDSRSIVYYRGRKSMTKTA